jgi:hypothetical protein
MELSRLQTTFFSLPFLSRPRRKKTDMASLLDGWLYTTVHALRLRSDFSYHSSVNVRWSGTHSWSRIRSRMHGSSSTVHIVSSLTHGMYLNSQIYKPWRGGLISQTFILFGIRACGFLHVLLKKIYNCPMCKKWRDFIFILWYSLRRFWMTL